MEFPCEIVAQKILPSVKAELARTMKQHSLSQRKIAEFLDLTEAAVSQYLSGKRAKEYSLPQEVLPMFPVVAKAIAAEKNPQVLSFGIGEICKAIRKIEKLDFKC